MDEVLLLEAVRELEKSKGVGTAFALPQAVHQFNRLLELAKTLHPTRVDILAMEIYTAPGSVWANEFVDVVMRLRTALELARPVAPVSSPPLAITSDVVNRAMRDAETLIREAGATSGVDRMHTALHGYLKAVCDNSKLQYGKDPSITELYRLVRTQHPKLQNLGAHSSDVDKILKSFGVAIDSLNTLRNRASVAHPNAELLSQDEALLYINVARTVVGYLDAKLA